jgi:hypothetical protein
VGAAEPLGVTPPLPSPHGVGVVLAVWGSLFGPFNALGWIAVGLNPAARRGIRLPRIHAPELLDARDCVTLRSTQTPACAAPRRRRYLGSRGATLDCPPARPDRMARGEPRCGRVLPAPRQRVARSPGGARASLLFGDTVMNIPRLPGLEPSSGSRRRAGSCGSCRATGRSCPSAQGRCCARWPRACADQLPLPFPSSLCNVDVRSRRTVWELQSALACFLATRANLQKAIGSRRPLRMRRRCAP